jgi:hypothetical protein
MSEPRVWRRVFPGADEATAIRALRDRWTDEYGGHPVPWDEAWLCGEGDGFATFLGGQPWTLIRAWVRPELRRQGLFEAAWPLFVQHYGAAFKVWNPNPAMEAFLAKVGRPTGPNPGARAETTSKLGA